MLCTCSCTSVTVQIFSLGGESRISPNSPSPLPHFPKHILGNLSKPSLEPFPHRHFSSNKFDASALAQTEAARTSWPDLPQSMKSRTQSSVATITSRVKPTLCHIFALRSRGSGGLHSCNARSAERRRGEAPATSLPTRPRKARREQISFAFPACNSAEGLRLRREKGRGCAEDS